MKQSHIPPATLVKISDKIKDLQPKQHQITTLYETQNPNLKSICSMKVTRRSETIRPKGIKIKIKAWLWWQHLDYSVLSSLKPTHQWWWVCFCMLHGYVQIYSTLNNVLEVMSGHSNVARNQMQNHKLESLLASFFSFSFSGQNLLFVYMLFLAGLINLNIIPSIF